MKRVVNIAIAMICVFSAKAQDPQFTQFYANPLYLAPSYSGGIPGHRATMNYRNQWTFVPGTFQTYSVSYDHNFMSFNSGLGLLVLGDYAGDGRLGTTMAGLLYSYDIVPHPDYHIRPGIGFYYLQHSVDYSRLIFGDQAAGNNTDLPPTVQPLGRRPYAISTFPPQFWPTPMISGWALRGIICSDPKGRSMVMMHVLPINSQSTVEENCYQTHCLRPIEESITGSFNLRFQGLSKQARPWRVLVSRTFPVWSMVQRHSIGKIAAGHRCSGLPVWLPIYGMERFLQFTISRSRRRGLDRAARMKYRFHTPLP